LIGWERDVHGAHGSILANFAKVCQD